MLFMIKAQYNCTSYGIIIILLKLLQKRETMLSQTTFFTPLYDIPYIKEHLFGKFGFNQNIF